jgi:hypothetical protein
MDEGDPVGSGRTDDLRILTPKPQPSRVLVGNPLRACKNHASNHTSNPDDDALMGSGRSMRSSATKLKREG